MRVQAGTILSFLFRWLCFAAIISLQLDADCAVVIGGGTQVGSVVASVQKALNVVGRGADVWERAQAQTHIPSLSKVNQAGVPIILLSCIDVLCHDCPASVCRMRADTVQWIAGSLGYTDHVAPR